MRIAALAAALAFTGAAAAQDLVEVRYANDWKWEGPAAPFLLALERGYYEEEGLDVAMDTGQGSREAIPRVASGAYDMGFADINSLIRFKDQNPDIDVKAVFMVYDKPPFAIIGRRSLGVSEPKDLEGRTLGAPAPDGAYAQWNAFVEAAGIDPSKVTIENVGFPVREPMLVQGEVDAVTGFSFSSFLNLKGAGVPEEDISVILMADHGLELYGNAVIVNPGFAEAHPEAVTGFIEATLRGLREVIADPEAGVEAVLAHNDVAREEIERERLEMALAQNLLTPAVREHGFGGVDMERLARSIDQIALTFDFDDEPPAPEEVFDPSFLPPQEERMIE
jgi:NitT/TauT family transport system substrate-binding protein